MSIRLKMVIALCGIVLAALILKDVASEWMITMFEQVSTNLLG